MRRKKGNGWLWLTIAMLLIYWLMSQANKAHGQDYQKPYEKHVESVVVVRTTHGNGVGTVIGKNTVVTTYHGVQGDSRVLVYFHGDPKPRNGTVEKYDEWADLAIIHVQAGKGRAVSLEMGAPSLSEETYSIGHPLGRRWSFVVGRVMNIIPLPEWDERYPPIVLVNMTVDSGSSGSPLWDERGRVWGFVKGYFGGNRDMAAIIPARALCVELTTCQEAENVPPPTNP